MSRVVFDKLVVKVQDYINYTNTNYRDCISTPERLAVFLYRLGHRVSHFTISNIFGIGESTSRKISYELLMYFSNTLSEYIKFPDGQRLFHVMQRFEHRNFPQCCGIVDGTHIPVKSRWFNKEVYFTRKGYCSINCLIIVDAEDFVIGITAGTLFHVGICFYFRIILFSYACTYATCFEYMYLVIIL